MNAYAITHDELDLEVRWPGGESTRFPWIWMRVNEPAAFDPVTRERRFDLAVVAPDIRPDNVALEGDMLVVRWPEGEGVSHVPMAWLEARRPDAPLPADPAAIVPELWDASLGEALPRHPADGDLKAFLTDLKRFGLALVEGLGDDPEAGVAFGQRIACIRETYFGRIFEVYTHPRPNSLAYTAHALVPHTDLPYFETPPGVQFLHCVRNGAVGGASLFVDGFCAGRVLRDEAPEDFDLLSRRRMPYRFIDDVSDMRHRRPVLALDDDGELTEIALNPALADEIRLDADPAATRRYYAACRRLMTITRRPELMLHTLLEPGTTIAFDNRRVLHGRDAFDPTTGERWLRGFYIDRTDIDSRLRCL